MFKHAITLIDIAGFRIRVDPTWFVIAFLLVWSLSSSFLPEQLPGLGRWQYLAFAVLAASGFFASLVAHELAHALVARRFGLNVGAITLFVFGGVAELDTEPRSPGSEFWIALAGPAASLALAGSFFGLEASLAAAGIRDPAVSVLGYLGFSNAVLAAFNIVPAFPMDGGRILRAALWRWWGDLTRATEVASRFGIAFGLLLVALGALGLFAFGALGGLWLIVLGSFLVIAARSAVMHVAQREALKERVVADIMTTRPATIGSHDDADMVAQTMLNHHTSMIPVVDEGVVVGLVDLTGLRKVNRERWSRTPARAFMVAPDAENSVGPDTPTADLLDRIMRGDRRKFLVLDGPELLGIVTLNDVLNYLSIMLEIGPQRPRSRLRADLRGTERTSERTAKPSPLGLG